MTLRWFMPALALITAVIVGAGLYQYQRQSEALPRPQIGGDFTLQSEPGPVSLADFRGKVVVLSFGYASCPDVCPTTLGSIAAAMAQLSEAERASVQTIFVTIDPERDDANRMAEYTRHFYKDMIGLTGTPEQIAEVAKQYLVIYQKVPMPDSALGYAMDHSARIYVVDARGQLAALSHHGSPPADLAADIRDVLQGKSLL
jgi:protein SCO1/2